MSPAKAPELRTLAAVDAAVANVRALKDDDERAHGAEDALFEGVLRAIANGADEPAALAKAALATRRLGFARWTA